MLHTYTGTARGGVIPFNGGHTAVQEKVRFLPQAVSMCVSVPVLLGDREGEDILAADCTSA